MNWTKKNLVMAIVFLLIVIISVVVLAVVILDETFIFQIIRDYFILPLLDLGIWAVFIFLFLMVIQSLIAPIPSELVLLSGGMIFGVWGGIIIGIIGSMLSAWITYYVSNKGGRTIIEATGTKLNIVEKMILLIDEWIEQWGFWAIIVGRAVPFIMFDPVSYASGLSNIKWTQYTIATFLGTIPRAIFYVILGTKLLDGRHPSELANLTQAEFEAVGSQFNTVFFMIFGVLLLMLVIANILAYRRGELPPPEGETFG